MEVTVTCDRCKRTVTGTEDESATGGFYKTNPGTAWAQFTNQGESIVCDSCMWADERYIAIPGKQAEA